MRLAPIFRGRTSFEAHTLARQLYSRCFSNDSNKGNRVRKEGARQEGAGADERRRLVRGGGSSGLANSKRRGGKATADLARTEGPSLVEQLFPEEEARRSQQLQLQHRREHEVARLPLDDLVVDQPIATSDPQRQLSSAFDADIGTFRSQSSSQLKEMMKAQGSETSVLVLRNGSKNLMEEDFRRVIPQGWHMDGWTMEQGDILKVIPGRDLATLAPTGYYFLLFASPLSAFAYQGHVTRIHRIVRGHTPGSLLSPIPPPPGYIINGVDVHAAMNSFALVPPTQSLDLRQLKPPLTPLMASIVNNGGYSALLRRRYKQPYEARLVLDGPQLSGPVIRHILYVSGRERGLSWSTDDEQAPSISRWDPLMGNETPSPSAKGKKALRWAEKDAEREQILRDVERLRHTSEALGTAETLLPGNGEGEVAGTKRRTPPHVYIVGFNKQSALQSFVQYWHRRPLHCDGVEIKGTEGEEPPTAHVEVLW